MLQILILIVGSDVILQICCSVNIVNSISDGICRSSKLALPPACVSIYLDMSGPVHELPMIGEMHMSRSTEVVIVTLVL